MKEARMLGFRVSEYAKERNVSPTELSSVVGCTETQFKAFLKGRVFLSFEQLSLIAKRLNVDVSSLLSEKEEDYYKNAERCTGKFADNQNRELILDIVDEYMDLIDATM